MKITVNTSTNKSTMDTIVAVLSLVLLISSTGFCQDEREGKAIGSSDTVIARYPYTVSFHDLSRQWQKINYNETFSCGGFIVSRKNIVTACHCVKYLYPNQLHIRAGSTYYNKGGKILEVKNMTCHPEYHMNWGGVTRNDIAVVELVKPLTYARKTQKVKIYSKVLDEDEWLIPGGFLSGWGKNPALYDRAPKLQELELPIISKNKCKDDWRDVIEDERKHGNPTFDAVYKDQMCAGIKTPTATQSVCFRDSGGPLTVVENGETFVIGIAVVAEDPECNRPTYPNIFTEIAYHLPWLKQHITCD